MTMPRDSPYNANTPLFKAIAPSIHFIVFLHSEGTFLRLYSLYRGDADIECYDTICAGKHTVSTDDISLACP